MTHCISSQQNPQGETPKRLINILDKRREPHQCLAEIHAGYAVHPMLTLYGFDTGGWTVVEPASGVAIATFTHKHVAINFAGWLQREYSDLSDLSYRVVADCLTSEDLEICHSITDKVVSHPSFIDPRGGVE